MLSSQAVSYMGNLRKNVKFQFFGDRMEKKKHFIFIMEGLP